MSTPPVRTSPSSLGWGWVVAILLVMACGFLGTRGLGEPDEGRYAQVAVEMLEGGHAWLPTLHGEVHLTKPPMTYWAIAGGLASFGHNAWGVRLYLAASLIACGLLLAAWGARACGEPAGRWCGLMFATMPIGFAAMSLATADALLLVFELIAFACLWRLWEVRGDTAQKGVAFAAWAALGCAFLTKGPPGLIPVLVFAVFVASVDAPRKREWLASLFSIPGVVAFLVIGFGWYAVVAGRHDGALAYWLGTEVVDRIAGGGLGRNVQWYQPFKVYVLPLLGGSLPWLGFITAARRSDFRGLRRRPWAWLLLIWIVVPLIVFTISSSRQVLYVLPIVPGIALGLTGLLCRARLMVPSWCRRAALVLFAIWCVTLLGVRQQADGFSQHRNSKAVAAFIERERFEERELVVVERKMHALGVYLPGIEFESARVNPAGPTDRRPLLSDTLSTSSDAVLIVHDKQLGQVEELLAEAAIRCRRIDGQAGLSKLHLFDCNG